MKIHIFLEKTTTGEEIYRVARDGLTFIHRDFHDLQIAHFHLLAAEEIELIRASRYPPAKYGKNPNYAPLPEARRDELKGLYKIKFID